MNSRERLEKTIVGEATDRVPVALWRYFPGDDQRSSDLARSIVDYQKAYGWDFVKVTPASSYGVADYGVQDQWEGALDGTRVYTKRAVVRSLDWTDLRTLDPGRGALGRQSECLRLVCEALGETVPVVQTIISPLSQAAQVAGGDVLLRHMRMQPDRLRSGLNIITESILRFMDALRRQPVAGIAFVMEHASYDIMSEDEYAAFGLPYDRKILDSLPDRWWLNSVHLHGSNPMFRFVTNFPVQVVNWQDRDAEPTLAQAKLLFPGALCGGLSAWDHLHQGTPSTVRDAARDAIIQMNGRRLILGAGGIVPVTAPLSNIRAVREVVQNAG